MILLTKFCFLYGCMCVKSELTYYIDYFKLRGTWRTWPSWLVSASTFQSVSSRMASSIFHVCLHFSSPLSGENFPSGTDSAREVRCPVEEYSRAFDAVLSPDTILHLGKKLAFCCFLIRSFHYMTYGIPPNAFLEWKLNPAISWLYHFIQLCHFPKTLCRMGEDRDARFLYKLISELNKNICTCLLLV